MIQQSALTELSAPNNQSCIYLAPFTLEAVVFCEILRRHGIVASGFLDAKKALSGITYQSIPIYHTDKAIELSEGARIILCSGRFEAELRAKYAKSSKATLNSMYAFDPPNDSDLRDAYQRVNHTVFSKIAPFQSFQTEDGIIREMLFRFSCRNQSRPEALLLWHTEMPVTERCSLRCAGCSNMMQYFTKPKDASLEDLCEGLNLYFQNVDFLCNLVILGGEPFLYRSLPELLRYCVHYEKQYGHLRLTTNGTILPNEDTLEALCETGTCVTISHYGVLSSKVDRLKELLRKRDILHYELKADTWFEYQQLVKGESRNSAQVEAVFSSCKMRCHTIKDKRLSFCPFIAQANSLNAIPLNPENSLRLDDSTTNRNKLYQYTNTQHAFPACRWCSGYAPNAKRIPVAQQIKVPLAYKVYGEGP